MLRFEEKPIIGMVHLPPLPGSPCSAASMSEITAHAVQDAEALLAGGVDALMLENFGDTPFYPGRVPPITIACMTRVAGTLKQRFGCPLGVNVLRNDGESALALAVAVEADFIRVNVLCGARLTDQGLVSGAAHELLRKRSELHAEQVQIWADVDVKHSAPITPRPLAEEVTETVQRGHADALILTGTATGRPVDPGQVQEAKQAAGSTPVLVGSGVSAETMRHLIEHADGFIVGSALKRHGLASNLVELARVESLVRSVRTGA